VSAHEIFGEPFNAGFGDLVEAMARVVYEDMPMEDSCEDLDGRTIHAGPVPWSKLPEYGEQGSLIIAECISRGEVMLAKLRAFGIRTVPARCVTMPLSAEEARAMILAGEHFLKNASPASGGDA